MIESNDVFDDINDKKKFISNLPKKIFADENIYHSYLYMTEKMLKSDETDKINTNFYFLVSNLKKEEQLEYFKYFIPVVKKYSNLELTNEKKVKPFIKNVDLLLTNILYYFEIFGEEFLNAVKSMVVILIIIVIHSVLKSIIDRFNICNHFFNSRTCIFHSSCLNINHFFKRTNKIYCRRYGHLQMRGL